MIDPKKRNNTTWRTLAAFAFDVIAVAAVWLISYLLRFNGVLPHAYVHPVWMQLIWVIPIYAVLFQAFGLYRGMWLFASLLDLIRIAKAVVTGALVTMIGSVLVQPTPLVPRSVLIVSPILLVLMMGGARAFYRAAKEFYMDRGARGGQSVRRGKPVLILGAGRAGAALARELSYSPEWRLLGLLDDDSTKVGREIYGYRVLGSIDAIDQLTSSTGIGRTATHVIIAMPGATAEQKRRVAALCMRSPARVMTLPQLTETAPEGNFLSRVRNIDLEDLLGRDAVSIDAEHVGEMLHERVVMVTGAGGSIGSELCRQIAQFTPAQLIAFDQSEFSIYRLGEEFRERHPEFPLVEVIGDVKDGLLLEKVMMRYRPSVVFHAAAYKHVPLMEDVNAWQSVRNNVYGTYQTAMAATRAGVGRFVLISTDKAVNPTNVMGASKRLAEMVCQALQQRATPMMTEHASGNLMQNDARPAPEKFDGVGAGQSNVDWGRTDICTVEKVQSSSHRQDALQFEIVRFGNVLGSAGSVIPKFQEQIAKGGPVTVTHPDITRFFMTIPEASQLVLQASSMGRGGEIFVLDMGRPMRIVDLARDLIRLYGFTEEQIGISYTGLRPGEKLFEELLADAETTRPTHHAKLLIARTRAVPDDFLPSLLEWLTAAHVPDDDDVRVQLGKWLEEYVPSTHAVLSPPAVPQAH
ncbi:polysaccharide biosynthesis protein [Robbsia andropogonis]|uniref:polysaccharide biosynthesis protein n=1 Tax=Robbsia andropogonis TaxID=28092 RepID=UPI00209EAFC5|nr:nucleoside-diphosphate sugar epimerase/dehydratase [Robbsia andropogonis]MCP1116621.1 polysaccharide biosynthesis protein [Robbsia andropogonis]MCP1126700.1 polysaccharide biosynthesis protein [Robbsia andropogonis]